MIRKQILVTFLVIFLFCGIKSAEIPDDICDGITFGYLAHPDPTRCTEYIICLFEEHHLFNCSQPGHIFYLPYTYCVRGDPETCQVLIPVTTMSPQTTSLEEIGTTVATVTSTTPKDISTTPDELTTTQSETSTATVSETITTSFSNFPTPPMTILTTTTIESDSETTTTSSNRPTGPPELCENTRFRFVADPDFCYRYYLCIAGVAFPGECEQGRIFNEQWQGCVSGDWDTCVSRDWLGRMLN